MLVRIRTIDGTQSCGVSTTSCKTSVEKLKQLVEAKWTWAWTEHQRLFFAGKELKDEAELNDYGIGSGDVVQLLVRGGGGGGGGGEAVSSKRRLLTKVSSVYF